MATESTDQSLAPVAVFDSGVGGLTVVSRLRELLPAENFIYLGDTARVPYGGKSRETIERYSLEIAASLVAQGAKMIVVACNSASALALDVLRQAVSVPVEGVIVPGVEAALRSTNSGHVGVMGTKATIGSGAYAKALRERRPDIRVTSLACPLLVPLIEEGMLVDHVTDEILSRYLAPLKGADVDTLVLGCTHYPLLAKAIARVVGPQVSLVDSAENCASAVRRKLASIGSLAPDYQHGSLRITFTDSPDGFFQVVGKELGLSAAEIAVRQIPPLGA
jgi:glutamate racemase